jgi:hypothetical protein
MGSGRRAPKRTLPSSPLSQRRFAPNLDCPKSYERASGGSRFCGLARAGALQCAFGDVRGQPPPDRAGRLLGCTPARAAKGAFPDDHDAPSGRPQVRCRTSIAHLVALDLLDPKLWTRRGPTKEGAIVSVPKAAVHEDDSFPARKHDVGATGQRLVVKPVAEPQGVEASAQKKLGLRILSFDPAHISPPLLGRMDVHLRGLPWRRRQ